MATVEKTVELIFQGVDNVSGVLGDIKGGFDKLDDAVQTIASPFAAVAEGVLKTDAAVAGLMGTLAAVSLKTAGDFNAGIAEIGTVSGTTAEQLAGFSTQILDYSSKSVFSIGDINNAIYEAVGSGVEWDKSLGLLRTSEELAVGSKTSLQGATDLLVSSLNAYGETTDKATGYSDSLFMAVKDGKMRMEDLQTTLANVTPIAAALGVPFSDLMAAIATLTASGMPAGQAIDKLKDAFTSILKPTEQASAAATSLGVEFGANALKTDGLAGTFDKLYTATGGNIDQLGKLFGSANGLTAVLVLAGNSSDKFKTALDDQANAAGSTSTAYSGMVNNFSLQNQNLVNNLTNVLIAIGQPLLDKYGLAVGALGDVFKAVSFAVKDDAFKPVLDAMNGFASDITDYLTQVAAAMPDALKNVDFTGLMDSLGKLGTSIQGWFGDIDLTTVDGLTAALQKGVDLLGSLVDATRGISDSLKPAVTAIKELVDEYNNMTSDQKAQWAQDFLGNALLLQQAGSAIGVALIAIGDNKDVFATISVTAINGLAVAVEALAVPFAAAAYAILGTVSAYARLMASIKTGDMKQSYLEMAQSAENSAERMGTALGGLKDKILTNLDPINQALTGTNTSYKDLDYWQEQATQSGTAFAQALPSINDPLSTVLDTAEAFGTSLEVIETKAKKVPPSLDFMKQSALDLQDPLEGAYIKAGLAGTNLADFGNKLDTAAKKATQSRAGFAVVNGVVSNLSDAFGDAASAASAYVAAQIKAGDGTVNLTDSITALQAATPGASTAMGAYGGSAADADKALRAAAVGSDDFRLKVLGLQADLVKTKLKLDVDLQVAKIQGETKQIEAAFSSLDTGIKSTGDSIVKLFGQLGTSMQQGNVLLNNELRIQISKENDRRDQEFRQQRELTQAIIDRTKLQIQAMQSGQGLIKIDGSGLTNSLQLVLWEILENVQLQANASAQQFLLGI